VADLTVISWRDIPAQVVVSAEGRSVRAELSDRFQKVIDAAAMKAGLIDSDLYLDEWRRESRPCGDDLERELAGEVARLEAEFTPERLRALARGGGRLP
jgi:hypothetical protein